MITITANAARQIRESAERGNMKELPMRIAATRNPDGSLHYGMGFDDNKLDGDVRISSGDIDVVVSPASLELLKGTVVDYVELEPGAWHFIFLNPNDPNYTPPPDQPVPAR
jgi:iron-sulfur cluster assembly protein